MNSDQRLLRFADRVRTKPEFQPPLTALRALGLTQDDVAAMRAGTWAVPPTELERAVDLALRAQLAPMREALQAARDALQDVVDSPPHPTDLPSAVQTVAAATIAIADALPVETPNTPRPAPAVPARGRP